MNITTTKQVKFSISVPVIRLELLKQAIKNKINSLIPKKSNEDITNRLSELGWKIHDNAESIDIVGNDLREVDGRCDDLECRLDEYCDKVDALDDYDNLLSKHEELDEVVSANYSDLKSHIDSLANKVGRQHSEFVSYAEEIAVVHQRHQRIIDALVSLLIMTSDDSFHKTILEKVKEASAGLKEE